MIQEISFEEIKFYWKNYLWKKYNHEIKKINISQRQKNYYYKAIEYLNQEQVETIIKPTFIGFFAENKIIGVESGYKTNTNYYRLRGLWVDENFRCKGIATKLIKYLEDKSNEKYIWSCPRESSLQFYLKYGFKISGLSEYSEYGQTYFVIKCNEKYNEEVFNDRYNI